MKVKIKMIKGAAGPEFNYAAGAVVEVDKELARAFIACGSAEAVGSQAERAEPVRAEVVEKTSKRAK